MPVVPLDYMVKIAKEGMDHYWSVVYSKTDDGLDTLEIKWKRDYEADMKRWEEKHGAEFDRIFGKSK